MIEINFSPGVKEKFKIKAMNASKDTNLSSTYDSNKGSVTWIYFSFYFLDK